MLGIVNSFMHKGQKWLNILETFYGDLTVRFLKYVWPFFIIMDERVKLDMIHHDSEYK